MHAKHKARWTRGIKFVGCSEQSLLHSFCGKLDIAYKAIAILQRLAFPTSLMEILPYLVNKRENFLQTAFYKRPSTNDKQSPYLI